MNLSARLLPRYYAKNGVEIDPDAVFISDGAKSDTGNITELFAKDNVILVPDPVYPGLCRYEHDGRQEDHLYERDRGK